MLLLLLGEIPSETAGPLESPVIPGPKRNVNARSAMNMIEIVAVTKCRFVSEVWRSKGFGMLSAALVAASLMLAPRT